MRTFVRISILIWGALTIASPALADGRGAPAATESPRSCRCGKKSPQRSPSCCPEDTRGSASTGRGTPDRASQRGRGNEGRGRGKAEQPRQPEGRGQAAERGAGPRVVRDPMQGRLTGSACQCDLAKHGTTGYATLCCEGEERSTCWCCDGTRTRGCCAEEAQKCSGQEDGGRAARPDAGPSHDGGRGK